MILIKLLAIYGITFSIKEIDGPFGIIAWMRNVLMTNKHVGVFFYNLLSCYMCIGFHAGYIVYLASTPRLEWNVVDFILWAFAGGIFSIIMNTIVEYLSTKKEDNADL